jgi:heme exporter protein A
MREVACWRGGRLLFEGLDLALAPGEAVLVRGPNGTGKSSLLRVAARLLRPLAGTVEAADCALADETLALDRDLTLRRALLFWARLDGGQSVDSALAALRLSELADVPVRLLSTGQARRARLARVLASGAPLWLLDEPLNGLDEPSVDAVEVMIEHHRQQGGAVLAASHLPIGGRNWRVLELAE